MAYLDFDRLNEIDPVAFQAQKPYPWINPQELITQDGYQELLTSLPEVILFERRFGIQRAHGQQSHDRYTLEYHDGLLLAKPWKEFVEELQGKKYHNFLKKLLCQCLSLHGTGQAHRQGGDGAAGKGNEGCCRSDCGARGW